MIGLLQSAYFAVSNIDKITPSLFSMSNIDWVNGYKHWKTIDDRYVPDRINALDSSKDIVFNLNIMLIVPYLVLILGVFVFLLTLVARKLFKKIRIILKLERIGFYLLK